MRQGTTRKGGCRARAWRWVGVLGLSALLAVPAAAAAFEITVLSGWPDMVTGGDALVRIEVPAGTDLADVTVLLNRADVKSAFSPDPSGHALLGLVTGLRLGPNTLEARARGAGGARQALVNHPITGPVFSGPHEKPFFCQTHTSRPSNLLPFLTSTVITDPCHAPTQVHYLYRTTSNQFALFDPTGPPPANLATTTTIDGQVVPYIVRVEVGTINRAIYHIAILDDPATPGPDALHAEPGWNRRLVYTFGGGCGGGHYIQGVSTGGVLNDMMLSRGFAVASASLNVLGNNCNDVVSAETLMMVKERFIEQFGVPRYTVGWGCSGGAIQQYMIANNYPGLLDGLLPQCSFPDVWGTGTFDARLMLQYFLHGRTVPWTQQELTLASGFATFGQIQTQGTSWAARIDPVPSRPDFPSYVYNNIVPLDVRYDPVTNPGGARATTWDHNVNTLGRDRRGFARRPLDNVGIQYGLGALNAGHITLEQFLDLNARIGGLDIDANFIPERMAADRAATRASYQTGKIMSGAALDRVPILDFDVLYTDLSTAGDVHMKYYHFSVRERIAKVHGHADNMVMWSGVTGPRGSFASTEAFLAMVRWLDAITADASDDPLPVKVVRNKPADLVDGCWTGTTSPFTFIAEPQFLGVQGTSTCNDLYPGFTSPRHVAGMSLANDVIKCRLKPVDPADYQVPITPADLARLKEIFPDGVCDFSRPGLEQEGRVHTWLTYPDVGKYHP